MSWAGDLRDDDLVAIADHPHLLGEHDATTTRVVTVGAALQERCGKNEFAGILTTLHSQGVWRQIHGSPDLVTQPVAKHYEWIYGTHIFQPPTALCRVELSA